MVRIGGDCHSLSYDRLLITLKPEAVAIGWLRISEGAKLDPYHRNILKEYVLENYNYDHAQRERVYELSNTLHNCLLHLSSYRTDEYEAHITELTGPFLHNYKVCRFAEKIKERKFVGIELMRDGYVQETNVPQPELQPETWWSYFWTRIPPFSWWTYFTSPQEPHVYYSPVPLLKDYLLWQYKSPGFMPFYVREYHSCDDDDVMRNYAPKVKEAQRGGHFFFIRMLKSMVRISANPWFEIEKLQNVEEEKHFNLHALSMFGHLVQISCMAPGVDLTELSHELKHDFLCILSKTSSKNFVSCIVTQLYDDEIELFQELFVGIFDVLWTCSPSLREIEKHYKVLSKRKEMLAIGAKLVLYSFNLGVTTYYSKYKCIADLKLMPDVYA